MTAGTQAGLGPGPAGGELVAAMRRDLDLSSGFESMWLRHLGELRDIYVRGRHQALRDGVAVAAGGGIELKPHRGIALARWAQKRAREIVELTRIDATRCERLREFLAAELSEELTAG